MLQVHTPQQSQVQCFFVSTDMAIAVHFTSLKLSSTLEIAGSVLSATSSRFSDEEHHQRKHYFAFALYNGVREFGVGE
jgi:hypothetical protein